MIPPTPKQQPESDAVGEEEGFEQATPEEQAQFDDFIIDGMAMIYGGGEVKPGILKLLDNDPSDLKKALGDQAAFKDFTPGVALAAATVVIVLELVRSADGKPEDAVILHGGKRLMEELAQVCDEAGIHDFTEDELNRAFIIGLDLYREAAVAEGLIDEAGMANLAAEFEEIKAADAQGAFSGGQEQQAAPEPMMGGIGPKP